MELLHPWAEYARLQNNLSRECRVSDRSWGIEAGMDHILTVATIAAPCQSEINQVIATARRRERYRGSRQADMPEDLATPHPETVLVARSELKFICKQVSNDNFKLLKAVASGVDYDRLSKLMGSSPETLRARVSRLRKEVRALVA